MSDTIPIVFASHAAIRYRDRCRPGLDVIAARQELARIVRDGLTELTDDPPSWLKREDNPNKSVDKWLCYGPDVAFPMVEVESGALVAQTCLCAGGIGPGARAYRSQHRRNVAARKRAIKANGKHLPNARKDGPSW